MDLIRQTRLRARVYHNAVVCGDWQLDEYHPGTCCFHMVTAGQCRMQLSDEEVLLNEGDLVFFPREIAHKMVPLAAFKGAQQHLAYTRENVLQGTGLLCGAIYFDHPCANQLLDELPVFCVIPASANYSWFTSLFDLILAECYSPSLASSVILDRLSELIFIHCLQYLIQQSSQKYSLLALYAHSKLAKVLSAVHAHPEFGWTLETLAQEVNMSRTQFAKVFRNVSGWTAMRYVTWWRMQLAVDLLRRGESFGRICDTIGYESEAAFQRTFKQVIGVSPGKFRIK